MPKQFVKIFANTSLFQLTVERNKKLCDTQLIVSNNEQYFLALNQLEEMQIVNQKFLLEPIGKNTAPAITLACMSMQEDELVLVTPSDHLIKNQFEYEKVLNQAKSLANENYLVTFGITPTFPETAYGYIEADCYNVKAFHEKPDLATATQYLTSGNYYWNSGMFCFKAGIFLNEVKKYAPEIFKASLNALSSSVKRENGKIILINHDEMSAIPENSVDYAILEHSKIVKVIPSKIHWSDVGSFDSLYNELPKDSMGNTINEKHISINSSNNFVYSQNRHIATIDVNNFIIVDTADALLIAKQGSSQQVKDLVKIVKQQTQLHYTHLTGFRPWGTYTILEDSPGYKIKRIEVNPRKRLSLQKHSFRNEHWVVISGEATVTINDHTVILKQNESTYIKAGDIHRLHNQTNEILQIIEVQVGEYTGEDDIVRLEDDFDRKGP